MVTTASAPIVTVPRSQVAAQIQTLGLPRNALGAIFELPEGSTAVASWQTFGPEEQAALQLALPLLACPALVTRTRAMIDEGHFLSTWIVTGSGNDPALTPYLLLAHDEDRDHFQMKPVLNRDTVARSLMPYLDAGLPTLSGEAFELPVKAFALLVTLCDLVRRARFSAGLDHAPVPEQFTTQDIERALADARESPDPRWLLPHLLAIRPDLSEDLDPIREIQTLASHGWLTARTGTVSLTEPGISFALALDRRISMIAFWTVGATPQGDLASRSTLFIRSPWQLWCFDVGGEDGLAAIGAPVDVAAAYGLVQDLLTPVGVPRPMQENVAAPAPPKASTLRLTAVQPVTGPAVKSHEATKTAQPKGRRLLPIQLVAIEGTLAGEVFALDDQATLGRSDENTIQLDDELASRRHARIGSQGDAWIMEDLGSRNGTFVNRERIGQAVPLKPGDQIQIGNTLFKVAVMGQAQPAPAQPTCPHCGHQVPPTAQFCRYCGGSLPQR